MQNNNIDPAIKSFLSFFEKSCNNGVFQQLILAKPRNKQSVHNKIVATPIEKGDDLQIKLERFSSTQCFTEMHSFERGMEEIQKLCIDFFREAYLWTEEEKWDLKISKKGKGRVLKQKNVHGSPQVSKSHNRRKKNWVQNDVLFQELGILNASGNTKKGQGGKWRQINRFVELMSHLIGQNKSISEKKKLSIVDMGAGKGYLSFALYAYLTATGKWQVQMTGIERRKDLVDQCNALAAKLEFEGLHFDCLDIEKYAAKELDILVALHACDTATDDAIYKGIQSNASLIITAPCCHKELRHSLSPSGAEKDVLKHGILAERQSELVTDALRALALESAGYKSKVFEFISNQHTNKNLMVVGSGPDLNKKTSAAHKKMKNLMHQYGIDNQRLYDLLYKQHLKD